METLSIYLVFAGGAAAAGAALNYNAPVLFVVAAFAAGSLVSAGLLQRFINRLPRYRQSARMQATLDELAALDNLDALPYALACDRLDHPAIRKAAAVALARLLSSVSDADVGRFDARARRDIAALLDRTYNIHDATGRIGGYPVSLAALSALGAVGQSDELPRVVRHISGAWYPEEADAARVAAARIERRMNRLQDTSTLMRAAGAADAPDQSLLRAAQPNTNDVAELPRPSSGSGAA